MRIEKSGWTLSVFFVLAACGSGDEAADSAAVAVDPALSSVRAWVSESEPSEPPPSAAASADPVADLIGGLEARLEQDPNDADGWALLAQSYAYVGQMSDARQAVDRAVALGAERESLEARVRQVHPEGW